jgi:hypothetical protein
MKEAFALTNCVVLFLQGQLLEICALMLERLGRHKEALSVYVHQLHSMKLAEEYCDRVYEAGVAAATAAAPSSSAAAAAVAAAAAATAATESSSSSQGEQNPAVGWGSKQPGELQNPADGGSSSDGPKWDKVQLVRQQQQQQRQQQQQGTWRGFGVEGSKPSWSAMPFGGKPQDIYMELVDAVLQVWNAGRGGWGGFQVCWQRVVNILLVFRSTKYGPAVITNLGSVTGVCVGRGKAGWWCR